MKRYMVAAGVGSLVFAAAVGSASMLDVNAGVAQTGVGELGGDENGVKVVSYKAEGNTGESSGVRVARINGVPAGSEMFAVALDENDNPVPGGEASTTYTGGNEASFNWDGGTIDIADIDSLRLTFESGDA